MFVRKKFYPLICNSKSVTYETLIESLDTIGFSQYQASVYVAVLRLGSASAVDVANESSVPKSRVYDVLQELESQGYVETYQQGSLRVRALDPAKMRERLETQAESLSNAAGRISELWQEPEIENGRISLLKRRETVYEQTQKYIQAADNEIQLSATPAQFELLRSALQEAINRDVIVQLVVCPPNSEAVTEDLPEFQDAVTEARHRTIPAPFMLLVDRADTCFSPQGPGVNRSYGLSATNYPLAHVFHQYFQTTLWEWWDTLYSARSKTPPIRYINLRRSIIDIDPLLSDGAKVYTTIEAKSTANRNSVTLSGKVEDVIYTSYHEGETPTMPSQIGGQVSIVIQDKHRKYTVGGWYARIEEFEMQRLTIESIE